MLGGIKNKLLLAENRSRSFKIYGAILFVIVFGVIGSATHLFGHADTCGGPLTITQGGTYSGCWVSNNQGPAVTINTSQPVTITNSTLKGTTTLILGGGNAKITVTNSNFYGLYPGGSGIWGGYAVWLNSFDYFDFEHNYIEQKAGIKATNWTGYASSHPVLIRYNKVKNVDGRKTDGTGGYLGSAIAQFVQFDSVKNAPGVEIAWNEVKNTPNQSAVEDNISMFNSSGTQSSPINIHDNYIQGAYPFPATNTSYSGGGIMLGDGGGAYESAHDNQVVSTTNYGVAIAGGTNMSLYNNHAVASGLFADGSIIPAMNIGSYTWNQSTTTFSNAEDYNNIIGWWNPTKNARNDWWLPDCSTNCTNSHLHNNLSAVTLADEQSEAVLWQTKLSSNNATVGPITGTTTATTPDTTPPTTLISNPTNGSTVSGIIMVSANSSDNIGVARIDLYVDGTKVSSSTNGSLSYGWDTTTVAKGTHSLQTKAYDAAGNVGSSPTVSVNVNNTVATVDTIPPVALLLTPVNGAKISGNVTFSASASDNVQVSWIEIDIDGSLYASASSSSLSTNWNTKPKKLKGSHTITVKAKDSSGNWSTPAAATVTVI